jgi:hypothetical protein
MALVSIIAPTFKAKRFLGETTPASVQRQRFANRERIVDLEDVTLAEAIMHGYGLDCIGDPEPNR